MRLVLPIRWRIAAVSTLIAGVLIVGAGLIFVTTLRHGLERSVDVSLRAQSDSLGSQLTSTGALRSGVTRLSLDDDDTFGQVIDSSGKVVTSTPGGLSTSLVSAAQVPRVRAGHHSFDVRQVNPGAHEPKGLRVYARALTGGGGVVAVAVSRDVIDEAVERAGKQLLVLGAVVTLLAGAGSYLLAGTALRPVDRLRRQAAELEAHDLGAELAIPHTADEVQRLAVTLNALLARLHDAIDRERDFVADAGHELRSPLTVLRGELELARRPGRSREELEATVEVAADETERLISLAENLLTLAKDERAVDPLRQRFELMAVVRSAVERGRASVAVDVVGPERMEVDGDVESIRRVVVNLVANAERFARTTVTVTVRAVDGTVSIAVEDDGPGFPPEFRPHAFERFSRADTPRTRSGGVGGSGLGLSIVRAIALSHRGEASVGGREPGPGARVEMRWPSAAPNP